LSFDYVREFFGSLLDQSEDAPVSSVKEILETFELSFGVFLGDDLLCDFAGATGLGGHPVGDSVFGGHELGVPQGRDPPRIRRPQKKLKKVLDGPSMPEYTQGVASLGRNAAQSHRHETLHDIHSYDNDQYGRRGRRIAHYGRYDLVLSISRR